MTAVANLQPGRSGWFPAHTAPKPTVSVSWRLAVLPRAA